MEHQYLRPAEESDHLYDAAYYYPQSEDTCTNCNKERLTYWKIWDTDEPQVYYSLIATGYQLMKDDQMRN